MKIQLSELDRLRFGAVTAKASLDDGDAPADLLPWCASRAVELLIARCPTGALALAQQLEQAGARLMDTLVYFRRQALAEQAVSLPPGYRQRLATAADADAVERLAGLTFAGYLGHYHVDARLDPRDADAVYSNWAANSCRDTAVADAVILLEHGGDTVAFATLQRRGANQCEGVLFGVHPAHQGRRLYHALMQLAQNWALAQGIEQVLVSTQVTNLSVQKVWCRHGYEPCASYYTFHQWFDRP